MPLPLPAQFRQELIDLRIGEPSGGGVALVGAYLLQRLLDKAHIVAAGACSGVHPNLVFFGSGSDYGSDLNFN